VSVLPSVTDVAYLPMLTGQYPATADIPGIRWVDKPRFRPGRLFLVGHRSYVGLSQAFFTQDLSESSQTLFELCPDALAVRSDIHRGLPPSRNLFWKAAMPFMAFGHYGKRSDVTDSIGMHRLLGALTPPNPIPRFVFLPFLDVDTCSHAYGPMDRRTIAAYKRVDAAVGALAYLLERRGVLQKTHFIVTSDHGHTQTHTHLDLPRLVSEQGYKVFEHPNVLKRVATAAVMVSGNAFAQVYLPDRGSWERPLTEVELESEHKPLLQALRLRPEIEWFAYRHHSGAVRVLGGSGSILLNMSSGVYQYVVEDTDPLRLRLPGTAVRRADALAQTVSSPFPDALEQLWHLFASERTGDIVITAKEGCDLRARREWPEHHSSHGALCRDQMLVPVLSSLPLAAAGPVRTVDIYSTIADSLQVTPSKPHFGRSLWQPECSP
jgi:hypothetical protein